MRSTLNHRRIAKRLKEGCPMSVLATRYQCSLGAVRWIANKYRIKPKQLRRPWLPSEERELQATIEELAKRLNRTTGAILAQAMKQMGGTPHTI